MMREEEEDCLLASLSLSVSVCLSLSLSVSLSYFFLFEIPFLSVVRPLTFRLLACMSVSIYSACTGGLEMCHVI